MHEIYNRSTFRSTCAVEQPHEESNHMPNWAAVIIIIFFWVGTWIHHMSLRIVGFFFFYFLPFLVDSCSSSVFDFIYFYFILYCGVLSLGN